MSKKKIKVASPQTGCSACMPNTMQIPLGPQHPALKEPTHFLLEVQGEVVVNATPRIGYVHRGIEKLAETKTYSQNLTLVERVCGICSHVHSVSLANAVETALGIEGFEVPKRAQYIRTIVLELERVHSHILWLGIAAHEIGFDTLFMLSWRDRELTMDILEEISGNRVNYAINEIGGTRRDLSQTQIDRMLKYMDITEERINRYKDICLKEDTIRMRTQGIGILLPSKARELCAVGPTARASNVKVDVRYDDPYSAYDDLRDIFTVVTYDTNDVFSRVVVRIIETIEAVKYIKWLLKNLPEGPVFAKPPRKVPEAHVLSRTEPPRGELIHYLWSNNTDKPYRLKITTPTLANIFSVAEMLRGDYIADTTISLASIDPCFSCEDRMITIVNNDRRKPKIETWSESQLRRYSKEWYANKGWKK
ncbi:MAG TPA: nickel-dependent hydrogenase large subunit [candidate division Zixibacteria bacterium]|nr:nickel-dependent hydrogenase large subunit [candidate division Zixibacteria bacterium]